MKSDTLKGDRERIKTTNTWVNKRRMKISYDKDSQFPVENIPFGIFSYANKVPAILSTYPFQINLRKLENKEINLK